MSHIQPKTPIRNHRRLGYSIIEVLISISILGIVIASTSRLVIVSMHANKASRSYASLVTEVQEIMDQYRGASYNSLLSKFSSSFSSIADGQAVEESVYSDRSRASYSITLTAIKSAGNGNPEAVRVRVEADHRRGVYGNTTYDFETLISQAG